MKLAEALDQAARAATRESVAETGTERVRLAGLASVLQAEARVARQKEEAKPQHLCGAQGFDPWLGDTCEACEARKLPSLVS